MKSYPLWEQVKDDLGDKVVHAIGESVQSARGDLQAYRRAFPLWVAEATERGLAGWIHDRLWFHLLTHLDQTPGIQVADAEPRRELGVAQHYSLRIKRHHEDGHVSTYPTPTATEFLFQLPDEPFEGLEQVNLIAGYVWLRETREIGEATISLRVGSRIIWQADIDNQTVTESGVARPTREGPTPPTIEADEDEEKKRSDDGEE